MLDVLLAFPWAVVLPIFLAGVAVGFLIGWILSGDE